MLDINADTNVPSIFCAPGYETDERSAAVYIFKAACPAAENIEHRKPGQATDQRKTHPVRQITPASATNIANRKRYRFGKPRNHSGFGALLCHFLR